MKLEEAALKLGEKRSIRRKGWIKDDRIFVHVNNLIWRYHSITNEIHVYNFYLDDLNADDWEVVE